MHAPAHPCRRAGAAGTSSHSSTSSFESGFSTCAPKSLTDVFVLQPWIVLVQLVAILVLRQDMQHALHGQARPADAWLAIHHGGVDGDSFQRQRDLLHP